MTIGNLIDSVWNLPWYKLLTIAVLDDIMLIIRLWWLWLALMIVWGGNFVYQCFWIDWRNKS